MRAQRHPCSVAAIIVAAGSGVRMGPGTVDKLLAPLGGLPVLLHSIRAFEHAPEIDAVIIVVRADRCAQVQALVRDAKLRKVVAVVPGAGSRQGSVRAGLAALDLATEIVLIHDGARPLVDGEVISRGVAAARLHGAAVAGVPVTDTIKRVDAVEHVRETPRRAELRAVQTPQAFRLQLLLDAHAAATGDATDDASLVEALGHTVVVYPGNPRNIKITTPDDMVFAEAVLIRDPR